MWEVNLRVYQSILNDMIYIWSLVLSIKWLFGKLENWEDSKEYYFNMIPNPHVYNIFLDVLLKKNFVILTTQFFILYIFLIFKLLHLNILLYRYIYRSARDEDEVKVHWLENLSKNFSWDSWLLFGNAWLLVQRRNFSWCHCWGLLKIIHYLHGEYQDLWLFIPCGYFMKHFIYLKTRYRKWVLF